MVIAVVIVVVIAVVIIEVMLDVIVLFMFFVSNVVVSTKENSYSDYCNWVRCMDKHYLYTFGTLTTV